MTVASRGPVRDPAPGRRVTGALDVPGYREVASVLYREIPDAGHLLNLERPARFNEDVLSFLA